MAKIIYGVMGDSGGHISRALAVAGEMKEHEFLFVGGGCVAQAQDYGYAYLPFPMISTILKDNRVVLSRTIAHFCQIIMTYRSIVENMCRVIDKFQPDLAITDYEFFLPKAARRSGLKCISLDNQHILTKCRYPVPPGEAVSRLLTTGSVRLFF